jgi:chromate transporter
MARVLAPDRTRGSVAILTAIITLVWPTTYGQIILIAVAGLLGRFAIPAGDIPEKPLIRFPISRRAGIVSWVLFFGLLIALPLLRTINHSHWLTLFDSFYRVGSLVFGGGHVVLPMLQAELVPTGLISDAQFLAGYGAAQAVPGPLFTFSAYAGAVMNGWSGALIALCAMFIPSFLLVIGSLPFWDRIRAQPTFQSMLKGINAAVVGILLAALFNPVWITTIHTPYDISLALGAFGLLMLWKLPPWLVVLVCAAGGAMISVIFT